MKETPNSLEIIVEKIYEAVAKNGKLYNSIESGDEKDRAVKRIENTTYQVEISKYDDTRMVVIDKGNTDRVECTITVIREDKRTLVNYGYYPDKEKYSEMVQRCREVINRL